MINAAIKTWAKAHMLRHDPDVFIGGEENPYLIRWHVIPRNKWFNIYLHKVLRSDDDRALHDHPFPNVSYIIAGRYWEHTIENGGVHKKVSRAAGELKFRLPQAAHRLEVDGNVETITLFVTGPRVRTWGFHCPKGWVRWTDFVETDGKDSTVGRGCGET